MARFNSGIVEEQLQRASTAVRDKKEKNQRPEATMID